MRPSQREERRIIPVLDDTTAHIVTDVRSLKSPARLKVSQYRSDHEL